MAEISKGVSVEFEGKDVVEEVIGKFEDMKKTKGNDGKPRQYCFSLMNTGLPGMTIDAFVNDLRSLRDEKKEENLGNHERALKVLALFKKSPELFDSEDYVGPAYVLTAVPSQKHGASLGLVEVPQATGEAVKKEVVAAVNWPSKSTSGAGATREEMRKILENFGLDWMLEIFG